MRTFYSPDIVNAARLVREKDARAESDRNRQAELNAQIRRLDKDRIVLSALAFLEQEAKARGYRYVGTFIAGGANIERHTKDRGNAYVLDLLAEIRAQLSPLVK